MFFPKGVSRATEIIDTVRKNPNTGINDLKVYDAKELAPLLVKKNFLKLKRKGNKHLYSANNQKLSGADLVSLFADRFDSMDKLPKGDEIQKFAKEINQMVWNALTSTDILEAKHDQTPEKTMPEAIQNCILLGRTNIIELFILQKLQQTINTEKKVSTQNFIEMTGLSSSTIEQFIANIKKYMVQFLSERGPGGGHYFDQPLEKTDLPSLLLQIAKREVSPFEQAVIRNMSTEPLPSFAVARKTYNISGDSYLINTMFSPRPQAGA